MTDTLQDIDVWGSSGVAAQPVTVDMMIERKKLISLDEARARLAALEPLKRNLFLPNEVPVEFKITPGWNAQAESMDLDETVEAAVRFRPHGHGGEGIEYLLTLDCLLEACSAVGLPRAYTLKAPAIFTEKALNWWFNKGFGKQVQLLSIDNIGYAITRASIVPFSNIRFLDELQVALDSQTAYVDAKFVNHLRQTNLRIVLPEIQHQVDSVRNDPSHPDVWTGGISFSNSLIGFGQTEISPYLFAYLCTNGAVMAHGSNSAYNRRKAGQGDQIYEWYKAMIDESLSSYEHEFSKLDYLVSQQFGEHEDSLAHMLIDLFTEYRVPISARENVTRNLVNSSDLSLYGVLNAVTMVANDPSLAPAMQETIMRIGGGLASATHDRCPACHRIAV